VNVPGWTEESQVVPLLARTLASVVASLYNLRKVSGIVAAVTPVRISINDFRMLAKWCYLTRLETRTKESNIYASLWVANPQA
jgi:hypothetical protein